MRDLVLRYETTEGQVSLTAEEQQAGQRRPLGAYKSLCTLRDVNELSRQMYRLLAETVWVAASDSAGAENLTFRIEQLREQGLRLTNSLLPAELRQWIEARTDLHHVIFYCPEGLHATPVEGMVIGQEFVAYRYPVGKHFLGLEIPSEVSRHGALSEGLAEAAPYRAFSVVDPDQLLERGGANQVRRCWERFRRQWVSDHGPGGSPALTEMIDFGDVRAFRPIRKETFAEAFRQKLYFLKKSSKVGEASG